MATKQNINKDLHKKVAKEMELEVVSRENQREGLCKDCVRAESCSLSQNTKDVIWDCDDYADEQIAAKEVQNLHTQMANHLSKTQKKNINNPGLCPHCTHNDDCSLKTTEGGIWHCTDYA